NGVGSPSANLKTSVPTSARMDSIDSPSRSALDQWPPLSRSRRLITPLSPPTSRHRRPSVDPRASTISLYFRCLRTDFLNSLIASPRIRLWPGWKASQDSGHSRLRPPGLYAPSPSPARWPLIGPLDEARPTRGDMPNLEKSCERRCQIA